MNNPHQYSNPTYVRHMEIESRIISLVGRQNQLRREIGGSSSVVANFYETRKSEIADIDQQLQKLSQEEQPLLRDLKNQFEQYLAFQRQERSQALFDEQEAVQRQKMKARNQEIALQEQRQNEIFLMSEEAERKRLHEAEEAEKKRQFEAEEAEKQGDRDLQIALIQRDAALAQAEAVRLTAEANAKAQEQANASLDGLINGLKDDG